MSTDPTGRNFVSYRRTRATDIAALIRCLHEHGIPTWQDIEDLADGPTEDQIVAVLSDDATASASLWVTPDASESNVIKKVEAPAITSRYDRKDGFFVVAMAAGGLDYGAAARTLEGHTGLHDISNWNLVKVPEPIDDEAIITVTQRTLTSRIQAIHQGLPDDEPIRLRLFTRQQAPFERGYALSLDWHHAFAGRNSVAWEDRLLPALQVVIATIEAHAPGRRIVASGLLTISAAVCLGTACLAPKQLDASWLQYTDGQGAEWSIRAARSDSGFSKERTTGSSESDELAVLVSVADDVTSAFNASRGRLPSFRAILHFKVPGQTPHRIADAGQAADLVDRIVTAIREERRDLNGLAGVHFFLAVPVGVAMMLGQFLNTLGRVHLYEHIPGDGVGSYSPEISIMPSG